MKKYYALSLVSTFLFLAGMIASFFGFLNQGSITLAYTLIFVSLIYLLLGWFLFKGYHPDGHPLLLFPMGYLYASVFMAFALAAAGWPMAKTFIMIAIAWAAIQLVMVSVIRKKIPREGFVQFMIEAVLMLVMTISFIIKGF